jgi:UDP-N-acetylglucosamine:LPS N-acetylglucosamine transferase
VVVVDEAELEKQPAILVKAIKDVLRNEKKLHKMQHAFFSYAKPDAARDVANLLVEAAKKP